MQLFNQRLRWDGDLVFLYMRKHRFAFNPRLVGWKTLLFTAVYGVWQNIALPMLVVIFNVFVFLHFDINQVVALLIAQYFFYIAYALVHYLLFLVLVSERRTQDSKAALWLLLYPIYGLVMRMFSVFAIFNEVFRRGHEESNMAPWWVLAKGKRF